MAQSKVEKVMALLEAIRTQRSDSAAQFFSPGFIQHDPCIAPAIDGLKGYINDSPSTDLQLRVIRTIESDLDVVAQLKADGSGTDVFAVFRFQDGLIAEQWAFKVPSAPPNKSGHTQEDGPVKATHLADTEKNRDFAREYYQAFHLAGDRSRNDEFFIGDLMIRHEPEVNDGLSNFLRDVEVLMKHRTIDEIKLLVGEGDLVFIAAKGTHEGKPSVYIDLYRIENKRIVEHWGFPVMVPSEVEWKNANGML